MLTELCRWTTKLIRIKKNSSQYIFVEFSLFSSSALLLFSLVSFLFLCRCEMREEEEQEENDDLFQIVIFFSLDEKIIKNFFNFLLTRTKKNDQIEKNFRLNELFGFLRTFFQTFDKHQIELHRQWFLMMSTTRRLQMSFFSLLETIQVTFLLNWSFSFLDQLKRNKREVSR